MATVGYATLDVIPSFKGLRNNLERGMAGPIVAASSRAGTQAGAVASKGFASKFESGISGIGPKLIAGLGIAAAGKQMIGLQADFESSINVLGEAADLTAGEMARMAEFAKEMGASTVFSAGEAADAMVELAKAGLEPAAIEAGALQSTMAVAATEGLALAESATVISNAMTTFGIEGGRAVEVADALAGGSKASTASVASLSEAMSQVGGSAVDAGLSIQETVAALAAFDQEGIKGSDAGTSLKTMLTRLVPQTSKAADAMAALGLVFTDANGAFLPLANIAGQLQNRLGDLSAAERSSALNTIFGTDARRAALALMKQGEAGIASFTQATTEAGTAQRLADARMSGTAGAIEEMTGALETAGLTIGELFAPAVVVGADAIGGLAGAVTGLPKPVFAAAGAFAALRLATHFGVGPGQAVGALGSSMDSLRLRTMLATDAFRSARMGVLEFSGNSLTQATAGVGRLSASMTGLRAGAAGAGAAMKRGLSGGMALLGGPWGAAMIGGTALVTHFWQEHQAAKQFVDDLTTSLDEQTGALTDNSRQIILNRLESKGWLDQADEWGISLGLVKRAAEGSADALAEIREKVDEANGSALNPFNSENWTGDSEQFVSAIEASAAAIEEARTKQDQYNRFLDDGAEATKAAGEATLEASGAYQTYRERIEAAQIAVNELFEAENKRRVAAVQSKRDQLALNFTLRETEKEARKGKQTLDESTKAGRANWEALLDLADQWNNSTDQVKFARGAYKEMRGEFVQVAEQMGATDQKAQRLAERFLEIPERKSTKITTPGMERALADVAELRDRLKSARDLAIYVNTKQAGDRRLDSPSGFATGGMIGGSGSGTSDSNLIWASKGEFMQRKAAVDYYGADFMRRLNNMQIPKFANGGEIGATPARASKTGGVTVNIGTVQAHNYDDFMRQVQQRAIAAAGGGVGF